MGALDGRVAIVTGAGGGIGREHALAFAAAGAKVVVNDLGVELDGGGGSSGPAEKVVAEIQAAGGVAIANTDSVAGYDSAGALVNSAVAIFGQVDILVNNASVFRDGPFETMTPDDFEAVVSVHLFGTFNTCKHAVPLMVGQGRGRIINTTSSTWHSASGLAAYAASKAGIVGLSLDLAAEYYRKGITVNILSPSALTEHRTVQGQKWIDKLRAAGLIPDSPRTAEGSPPVQQPPDHVPPIVVFLASDAGAHVSGKVFDAVANQVGVYAHPEVVRRVFKDPTTGPWTQAELAQAIPALLAGDLRAPHVRD
jgi:NAD(P)-dependent dehydrogenase (short-subunit alcohol dehydrogenase family)